MLFYFKMHPAWGAYIAPSDHSIGEVQGTKRTKRDVDVKEGRDRK